MTKLRQKKVDTHETEKQSLKQRFGGGGSASEGRRYWVWKEHGGKFVADIMFRVCDAGDAVMFGRTRDGGAGTVTVLSGDERQRFYPDTQDALEAVWRTIAFAYSSPAEKDERRWISLVSAMQDLDAEPN